MNIVENYWTVNPPAEEELKKIFFWTSSFLLKKKEKWRSGVLWQSDEIFSPLSLSHRLFDQRYRVFRVTRAAGVGASTHSRFDGDRWGAAGPSWFSSSSFRCLVNEPVHDDDSSVCVCKKNKKKINKIINRRRRRRRRRGNQNTASASQLSHLLLRA